MAKLGMIGRISVGALLAIAVCLPLRAQEDMMTTPLPRDPEIAVREEFQMAERSNTPEGWQRFISRHAGHALVDAAKTRLKALQPGAN